jgi:hypothetical protein
MSIAQAKNTDANGVARGEEHGFTGARLKRRTI